MSSTPVPVVDVDFAAAAPVSRSNPNDDDNGLLGVSLGGQTPPVQPNDWESDDDLDCPSLCSSDLDSAIEKFGWTSDLVHSVTLSSSLRPSATQFVSKPTDNGRFGWWCRGKSRPVVHEDVVLDEGNGGADADISDCSSVCSLEDFVVSCLSGSDPLRVKPSQAAGIVRFGGKSPFVRIQASSRHAFSVCSTGSWSSLDLGLDSEPDLDLDSEADEENLSLEPLNNLGTLDSSRVCGVSKARFGGKSAVYLPRSEAGSSAKKRAHSPVLEHFREVVSADISSPADLLFGRPESLCKP